MDKFNCYFFFKYSVIVYKSFIMREFIVLFYLWMPRKLMRSSGPISPSRFWFMIKKQNNSIYYWLNRKIY